MTSPDKKTKQRVLVVAPGRGCYNKEELGYLQTHHSGKARFIDDIDAYRAVLGQASIKQLDSADKYSFKLHTAGENASALIYACAMADFMDIDTDKYEVVAVTGNSMGWYIALACAGALDSDAAIDVINSMGSMMQTGLIGGQLLYPEMDKEWRLDKAKTALIDIAIEQINAEEGCEVYTSIWLGGYRVFAGNEAGLKRLETMLPSIDERYPMRLYNHGAFHSPMLNDVSKRGLETIAASLFSLPQVPLIDGEGRIWTPQSTDTDKLKRYTLGAQVTQPYDFTKAIQVAVKEFAPDKLIVLGPGNTLGGPIAQALIDIGWFDWQGKNHFTQAQDESPKLLAMGNELQRRQVT
ncbi:ACP S-malonyltransferase [Shewanella sp. D64]|uniref:ACP S-malonyltransferase n=1 Tax=unclassified Shewanella TaxID=196818 RepID=UPI0022BA5580|nr:MULTISPECIES: ACP S-malonyltransferase [unclassified Shewanella]MEC4727291.1 ACP S-malonyltransferase [Shewanella sp. D64]MEC4739446.1 ACP S-malonyltransferase [Shewanella sp. E94]WBJ96775.1 ACP S-malonyltransferase [Shewanella sp. MTB7]